MTKHLRHFKTHFCNESKKYWYWIHETVIDMLTYKMWFLFLFLTVTHSVGVIEKSIQIFILRLKMSPHQKLIR